MWLSSNASNDCAGPMTKAGVGRCCTQKSDNKLAEQRLRNRVNAFRHRERQKIATDMSKQRLQQLLEENVELKRLLFEKNEEIAILRQNVLNLQPACPDEANECGVVFSKGNNSHLQALEMGGDTCSGHSVYGCFYPVPIPNAQDVGTTPLIEAVPVSPLCMAEIHPQFEQNGSSAPDSIPYTFNYMTPQSHAMQFGQRDTSSTVQSLEDGPIVLNKQIVRENVYAGCSDVLESNSAPSPVVLAREQQQMPVVSLPEPSEQMLDLTSQPQEEMLVVPPEPLELPKTSFISTPAAYGCDTGFVTPFATKSFDIPNNFNADYSQYDPATTQGAVAEEFSASHTSSLSSMDRMMFSQQLDQNSYRPPSAPGEVQSSFQSAQQPIFSRTRRTSPFAFAMFATFALFSLHVMLPVPSTPRSSSANISSENISAPRHLEFKLDSSSHKAMIRRPDASLRRVESSSNDLALLRTLTKNEPRNHNIGRSTDQTLIKSECHETLVHCF
eukprot:Lankesteria_metandrocarpae@DN3331_c0_g1_i1.p1